MCIFVHLMEGSICSCRFETSGFVKTKSRIPADLKSSWLKLPFHGTKKCLYFTFCRDRRKEDSRGQRDQRGPRRDPRGYQLVLPFTTVTLHTVGASRLLSRGLEVDCHWSLFGCFLLGGGVTHSLTTHVWYARSRHHWSFILTHSRTLSLLWSRSRD